MKKSNLLVILSRFPYPIEKGDKLRAYHQLKYLSEHFNIYLIALSDKKVSNESVLEVQKYCKEILIYRLGFLEILFNLLRAVFSPLPFQVNYFYSYKAQKKINAIVQKIKPNHIYCQLIRTAEYALRYKQIPKTIDYMDAFSKGYDRLSQKSNLLLKFVLKIESKRLSKYEKKVFDFFDTKTIISEQDQSFINHPNKNHIHIIPNGVDYNYFKPDKSSTKNYDIIFNGNMNYKPNVISVLFLVKEIIPLVKKEIPTIKVLISGTSPNKKIQKLKSDTIYISGWVEDIRTNLNQSKILVAPMHTSIGLQNKLLEAMAMQIPCVTSDLANNALKAEKDKEILTAKHPQEYATAIINLLKNQEFSKQIAENGYRFVLDYYSWGNSCKKLISVLNLL